MRNASPLNEEVLLPATYLHFFPLVIFDPTPFLPSFFRSPFTALQAVHPLAPACLPACPPQLRSPPSPSPLLVSPAPEQARHGRFEAAGMYCSTTTAITPKTTTPTPRIAYNVRAVGAAAAVTPLHRETDRPSARPGARPSSWLSPNLFSPSPSTS